MFPVCTHFFPWKRVQNIRFYVKMKAGKIDRMFEPLGGVLVASLQNVHTRKKSSMGDFCPWSWGQFIHMV